MDGYALMQEIRSRPELNDVKIAALTAFPASRTPPRESGLAAYFMKPIDPFDLVERIASELSS
jgi:CheY-like chemotaxis protein